MSEREAAREAAWRAASVIESALASGWEELDRYGADRPLVEKALADLCAELERSAGARPGRRVQTAPALPPTTPSPQRDETTAPVRKTRPSPWATSRPDSSPRRPRGLLSEPLWRILVDLYGAGPDGLSYGRHRTGWTYLSDMRRGRGEDELVTDRDPRTGQTDPDGRRWLTDAGRAHIAEHADRYADLYPNVPLREPAEVAADPLGDAPGDWQALVDVATGRLTRPADLYQREHAARWRPVLNISDPLYDLSREIAAYVDRVRDRGLVTDDGRGRWRLTDAGRAHYAAHHDDYTRRWPHIAALHPTDLGLRDENTEPVTKPDRAEEHEREAERREFEARLKPVQELPGYLMAEWPGTGHYYLVWKGERIGYAARHGLTSAWEARTVTGAPVPDADPCRTRIDALRQVAAHHRKVTPLPAIPAPGLPEGWTLARTLAEANAGRARLIAPTGRIVGVISRDTASGSRPRWHASLGDPNYSAVPIGPHADDPHRADEFAWRTQAAAVRALAAHHDTDLED